MKSREATSADVNIDRFVDGNIDHIRQTLSLIDPVILKNVDFSNAWVNLNLKKGLVQRTAIITRSGTCRLIYLNKIVTADLNYQWEELQVDILFLFIPFVFIIFI